MLKCPKVFALSIAEITIFTSIEIPWQLRIKLLGSVLSCFDGSIPIRSELFDGSIPIRSELFDGSIPIRSELF